MIRGGGVNALQTLKVFSNNIFRPLVWIPYQTIEDTVLLEKWKIFEDESNNSIEYLRNRIRNRIIPLLLQEKFNPDKLYHNFHTDYNLYDSNQKTKEKSYAIISKVNLENISVEKLKILIDAHLRILNAHPLLKTFLLEIHKCLNQSGKIHTQNSEVYVWKTPKSDLYIIPLSSSVFQDFKVVKKQQFQSVYWNHKSICIENQYTIGTYRSGIKIKVGNVNKKVSEIFRESEIPEMVRSKIPIVYENNTVIKILLELFKN